MKSMIALFALALMPLVSTASTYSPNEIFQAAPIDSLPAGSMDWFIPVMEPDEAAPLKALAPTIDDKALQRAIDAMGCAERDGHKVDRLIVIDMARHAQDKRLWAFDMDSDNPQLLLHERVAHGSGSDPAAKGVAERFSNTPNSHMTSLGLYKISERYHGQNGWSRRLDGLFAKFNGKARERAVVMHPSDYVNESRVGRSQGCPAVSRKAMEMLEKAGLKNAFLWIDAPDPALIAKVEECAKQRKSKFAAKRAERQAQVAAALAKQRQELSKEFVFHGAFDRLVAIAPDITGGLREPQAPHGNQARACRLTMPRSPGSTRCQVDAPGETMQ